MPSKEVQSPTERKPIASRFVGRCAFAPIHAASLGSGKLKSHVMHGTVIAPYPVRESGLAVNLQSSPTGQLPWTTPHFQLDCCVAMIAAKALTIHLI